MSALGLSWAGMPAPENRPLPSSLDPRCVRETGLVEIEPQAPGQPRRLRYKRTRASTPGVDRYGISCPSPTSSVEVDGPQVDPFAQGKSTLFPMTAPYGFAIL